MQAALFFEPGLYPRLPGPAGGPKGPKIGQKPGAGFIPYGMPSKDPADPPPPPLPAEHKEWSGFWEPDWLVGGGRPGEENGPLPPAKTIR